MKDVASDFSRAPRLLKAADGVPFSDRSEFDIARCVCQAVRMAIIRQASMLTHIFRVEMAPITVF